MTAPTIKLCILGQPLGHSLSPAFHTKAFEQMGIAGEFSACPMDAEAVPAFLQQIREGHYLGAAVTIPHKELVMGLMDELTPRAKSVGAVNTVYREGSLLWGDNTDVQGFLHPLQGGKIPTRAMILGAGGAARAIIVGLKQLRSAGMNKIFISARNMAKAEALSEEFSLTPIAWEKRHTIKSPWLINTTPLGMKGAYEEESPFARKHLVQNLERQSLAYDIVYNPLQTKLLQEAQEVGWQVQDGLDMFVAQALEQQKIWLGQSADFATMRAFMQGYFTS